MACNVLFAPVAMATTQFVRVIPCEATPAWEFDRIGERTSLRMSWVVVTDNEGNRKLQMDWKPSADLR